MVNSAELIGTAEYATL